MAFDPKTRALDIPPGAAADPECGEVLRAWIVNQGLQVSLTPSAFGPDGAPWGMLLVDIARHVARALNAETGADEQVTLATIRQMFDAEWDHVTDPGTTEKHAPKGH
jgi:hypothetical protein